MPTGSAMQAHTPIKFYLWYIYAKFEFMSRIKLLFVICYLFWRISASGGHVFKLRLSKKSQLELRSARRMRLDTLKKHPPACYENILPNFKELA